MKKKTTASQSGDMTILSNYPLELADGRVARVGGKPCWRLRRET